MGWFDRAAPKYEFWFFLTRTEKPHFIEIVYERYYYPILVLDNRIRVPFVASEFICPVLS